MGLASLVHRNFELRSVPLILVRKGLLAAMTVAQIPQGAAARTPGKDSTGGALSSAPLSAVTGLSAQPRRTCCAAH